MPCSAGRIHTGRSTASRPGTATCSPIATAVQAATCQRRSPLVRRRQAGFTAPAARTGVRKTAAQVSSTRRATTCSSSSNRLCSDARSWGFLPRSVTLLPLAIPARSGNTSLSSRSLSGWRRSRSRSAGLYPSVYAALASAIPDAPEAALVSMIAPRHWEPKPARRPPYSPACTEWRPSRLIHQRRKYAVSKPGPPRAFRAWPLARPSPSGPPGRSPGSTARRRCVRAQAVSYRHPSHHGAAPDIA